MRCLDDNANENDSQLRENTYVPPGHFDVPRNLCNIADLGRGAVCNIKSVAPHTCHRDRYPPQVVADMAT